MPKTQSSTERSFPESLDLNLLKALQALLATRSVTQAGERLGLSQSAASRIVARLRLQLQDPLLVRTANGYVLTPRASGLELACNEALAKAQSVFESLGFDESTARRVVRIATTDYGMLVVVVPTSARLALTAPGIGLSVQPWTDDTLTALEQGHLDLALYADDPLPPDFHGRDLFLESYAVLMRKDHPLGQKGGDAKGLLNDLANYSHVIASYPSGRRYLADDVLARLNRGSHPVAVEMPYFVAAPWLLMNTDRIMVLPQIAARMLSESHGLAWIPLPVKELSFSYRLIWHERAHRDPGLLWLRREIVSAVA